MPKRKKKATKPAPQSDPLDQYLAEAEIMSRQLSEAKTERQREKIRARMRRYIDQQNW
jgi:hypothetical protein